MENKKNHQDAPNIDYGIYSDNLDEQKTAINKKINAYEEKLVSLEMKEMMLNNIITRTNNLLENIDPGNFRLIGQTQSNLMKQIENLGLLKDIIIKYEDMIFKYRKVLLEINEEALNNRVKINQLEKEEKKVEDDVGSVLNEIQHLLSLKSSNSSDNLNSGDETEQGPNLLLQNIEQELIQENY